MRGNWRLKARSKLRTRCWLPWIMSFLLQDLFGELETSPSGRGSSLFAYGAVADLCNVCKTSTYDASCFYELMDPLIMYSVRVTDFDSELKRKAECCGKAEEWIHCMYFQCNTDPTDQKILSILRSSCTSFNTKWMITNLDDMRDWVIWEIDFLELKRDHLKENTSVCNASDVIPVNQTELLGDYEAAISTNASLIPYVGMFAEMTAFGYTVLASMDKDIETEWASYCGLNGCKPKQASVGFFLGERRRPPAVLQCVRIVQGNGCGVYGTEKMSVRNYDGRFFQFQFGQLQVEQCGKTSQFASFTSCNPKSVYLPHPTSYVVKGYLYHHGAQRTVACKAGLSTNGLYTGAQITCVDGTWTVAYPACPLNSMAVRLVIPTYAKALEQKIILMDIWLYGDRKCKEKIQLPRENLTFFVTPGFNDTIENTSHVWDSSLSTYWEPDWPNLIERLDGVQLYAGAVSSTKAIDWACLEFWYKGNRNWEELTWKVEMWDGAKWSLRAEIRDATGGSQKNQILQDACAPLHNSLDPQFTIVDDANLQNIVGVKVRIECTKDYYSPVTLPGGIVRVDQVLTCEPNLQWTPIRLKCLAACDKFYPVGPNYQVHGVEYLHGASRQVKCAEGYEQEEENVILPQTVRCSSGVWEMPFFNCRFKAPKTPPPIEGAAVGRFMLGLYLLMV